MISHYFAFIYKKNIDTYILLYLSWYVDWVRRMKCNQSIMSSVHYCKLEAMVGDWTWRVSCLQQTCFTDGGWHWMVLGIEGHTQCILRLVVVWHNDSSLSGENHGVLSHGELALQCSPSPSLSCRKASLCTTGWMTEQVKLPEQNSKEYRPWMTAMDPALPGELISKRMVLLRNPLAQWIQFFCALFLLPVESGSVGWVVLNYAWLYFQIP
jgi:hypothetical protein